MIKYTAMMGSNYDGEDKIVMASPVDIAEVAAEELTKIRSDKIRYIASDDITMNESASILGDAIGKSDLKLMKFSDEQARAGLIQAGLPEYAAGMLVELGTSMHNCSLREDYDLDRPEDLGKVKLSDFARGFGMAFNKH